MDESVSMLLRQDFQPANCVGNGKRDADVPKQGTCVGDGTGGGRRKESFKKIA
jgi:hypothetical protein